MQWKAPEYIFPWKIKELRLFLLPRIFQHKLLTSQLTERFIRGDLSRSTEGSGLGLSIAKTLTELQKGSFRLYLDGDLFKVVITFPVENKLPEEDK